MMLVTRTALSWAGPALAPASAVAPEPDPRVWFEAPACLPSPLARLEETITADLGGLTANELERRFLACLCLPGEGASAG